MLPSSRLSRRPSGIFARTAAALLMLGASLAVGVVGAAPATAAPGDLTIVPLEWNVVGLDSNRPDDGPSQFHHGGRVCNTTAVAITDVTVTWVLDTVSTAVSLDGPD